MKADPDIWDPKKIYNTNEFNSENLNDIYDYARSYLYFNGELPHGINQSLYKELNIVYTLHSYVSMLQPDMALPWTTKASELVVSEFLSFKNNKSKRTYTGLSGHDTNLSAWLIRTNVSRFDSL